MSTNYKPALILPGEDKPRTNAQVFATYEEAADSARARFMVWTMSTDWAVVETEDPVNYTQVDGHDVMVNREEVAA